jgi:hypothetical protein
MILFHSFFKKMKDLFQTVLFGETQNSLPIFGTNLLKEVASLPNDVQPDFSKVVVSTISVVRVSSDRTGIYSLKFKNPKLNSHVSCLRDPNGEICLAMVEPLASMTVTPYIPTPAPVRVGEEELLEAFAYGKEIPNSVYIVDVDSPLYPRLYTANGSAVTLSDADFRLAVRQFTENDFLVDLKKNPFELVLELHSDEKEEMTFDLVSKV